MINLMKSERAVATHEESTGAASDEGENLKLMKSQMQLYQSEEEPSTQQVLSAIKSNEERKFDNL